MLLSLPALADAPAQLATLGETSLEATAVTQAAFEAAVANQVLYLQTFINGVDSGLISPYRLVGGSLHGDVTELRLLGFRIEESDVGPGGRVDLARIPGLVYRLDTLRQVLEITVGADQFVAHRYDGAQESLRPQVSPGVTLNYDLFAQESRASGDSQHAETYSGFFDFRAFAQAGSFNQTALARRSEPRPDNERPWVRLDSALSRADVDGMTVLRAGDVISGGNLAWTTPVRLGGLQWQRNFRLQPNRVTFPLPTIRGSAAVPSTVDVLINNIQQYSQPVEPGPFTISNMPVITGQGEIRMIVRDAQGREQVTTMPFYAAPNLLGQGLVDYSVETGYLRRNFGIASNDYDAKPAALASVRGGVTEAITLEFHAEGAGALANAGVGSVLGLGGFGVLSTSLARSSSAGIEGGQWGAGYVWNSRTFNFAASTQRSDERYQTLASSGTGSSMQEVTQGSASVSVGPGGLSAGYVVAVGNSVLGSGAAATPSTTRLASLAYSWSYRSEWTAYASAFREFESGNDGVSAGLGYFFGGRTSASLSAQSQAGVQSANVQVARPIPGEGTGAGWRVQGTSGASGNLFAAAGYRAQAATVEIGASDSDAGSGGFASLRGSVVSMDWRRLPMLGNSANDSFALVDTGIPDVGVLYENRPVGRSNAQGMLLVPNLTAQARNQLAIDPRDVPLDADVEGTQIVAVPLERTGVLVKFAIAHSENLSVRLQQADGRAVPVGAAVTMNGGANSIVGYDGEAYLRHVESRNVVVARWDGGACEARFDFHAGPGALRRIGPLRCEPVMP